MKASNRSAGTATEHPFMGGSLGICQIKIHQGGKGRYFVLYWNLGLECIPSGRTFQPSDCTQEGRDLWVHTDFCGSCESCDSGQRVFHWALHRALVLVRLALIPLDLLLCLFLSIALLKHPVWHFHWKKWVPGSRIRSCSHSLSVADGQVPSWPAAQLGHGRWCKLTMPRPSLSCKKDDVWTSVFSSWN